MSPLEENEHVTVEPQEMSDQQPEQPAADSEPTPESPPPEPAEGNTGKPASEPRTEQPAEKQVGGLDGMLWYVLRVASNRE